ncbi:mitochondrial glycine transporter B-like isoform X1 [Achroia grisella]|uniref:mitochondrial glycine transporter B-like isoform X1 n=1 Tax=Achroia grisella TaxID=688607 RepID=UPI0027D1F6E5|nr:mitochondrial glycine transporter B-like isoform X1 [Achroia grisella]
MSKELAVFSDGWPIDTTAPLDLSNKSSVDKDYHPVLKAFLAGSFSGTFSTILFQPLDLVKTRLQNPSQHVVAATVNSRIQPGMINIFANIIRQEHVAGLWRGMVPSVARCVPGVGLYFSSLHWLKVKLGKTRNQDLGAMEAIALGVVARTMSGVALIPITVIKTRYESGVYKYNSLGGALKAIYRAEGIRGLSCGLGPTLARDAPFSGLYLMFYTQTKQAVPKEWMQSPSAASVIHFSCGIVAGIAASLATNPADVLKTKMQLYPEKFPNAFSAALYVHQNYGFKGYFKGAVPRMLRRTLMAAMAWTVFEEITRSIGLK